MPKNYLTFTEFRAAYSPKDDAISVTSGDPELAAAGFRMTLQRHTKAERILRAKLEAAGLLRLPQGEFPELVTYAGQARGGLWHVFPLGVDRGGSQLGIDVMEGPHTFVSGATGSGKTVLLNTLLAHAAGNLNRWQATVIDLARINYGSLASAPVLSEGLRVATDMAQAVEAMEALHALMIERYDMITATGRRGIMDLVEAGRIKAQLLVIEEGYVLLSHYESRAHHSQERMAETALWNTQRARIYELLLDIMRIGRAAGIHVVMGAQRFDYATFSPELMAQFDNRILLGRSDERKAMMILDWIPRELKAVPKGRGYVNLAGERDEIQCYFADRAAIKAAALNLS